jgi:hypothetical protein
MADAEGIAPDHVFAQHAQQVLDHLFLARSHIGLTPAMHPAFGLHPAEQQILRGSRVEQERFDARDFH